MIRHMTRSRKACISDSGEADAEESDLPPLAALPRWEGIRLLEFVMERLVDGINPQRGFALAK